MPKRIILSLMLAVTVGLTSLIPPATAAKKQKAASSKTQAQDSKQAAPNLNTITQAAIKAGVKSCAVRINQVENFLATGSQGYSSLMFLPANNPDFQMFSVSMEIPLKDASSAYASASFAPRQANGCDGMYETVVFWPQKCSEVAGKNFDKFKEIGVLSQNITVLDGGVSTKVFLLSAGTGCVSIKKEVVR